MDSLADQYPREKLKPIAETLLTQLDRVLENQKKLLIVLHNNPDPDALASGLALSYLVKARYNIRSTIAYDGMIGRAENQALVREIKIPLKNIRRIRFAAHDKIALLDTQPGAGNNSLPDDVDYHIVIDHHPRRPLLKSVFAMVDAEVGACATLLIELLAASDVAISTDLSTALTYAIRSETLDLGRETHPRDVKAYFIVYPKVSVRKLARIAYPKLPRSYFVMLAKALYQTVTFRQLICAHLGDISNPEIVAEAADILLRHERISWSLCTGRFENQLIISLRTSNPKANAGKFIKKLVPDRNNAGGHGMFAGGRIVLDNLKPEDVKELENKLSQQFAKCLGYSKAEWKPLLEDPFPGKAGSDE